MNLFPFDCLPVYVFYVFCDIIGPSYVPGSCPCMAVTLLANLPKSFVRAPLDDQIYRSDDLERRDLFSTLF